MHPQPIHVLVDDLRQAGFTVQSVTAELGSTEPVLEIVTPDRAHRMLVFESDYFRAPNAMCTRIRVHLRQLGYAT